MAASNQIWVMQMDFYLSAIVETAHNCCVVKLFLCVLAIKLLLKKQKHRAYNCTNSMCELLVGVVHM